MSTTGSSSSNGNVHSYSIPVTPQSLPAPVATLEDAQDWSSIALNYSLRLEHVATNIANYRILYHLKLEFEQPIPHAYLAFSKYLCLGWPLGGIWKITKRSDGNKFVTCVAWKKTELTPEEVAAVALEFVPQQTAGNGAASVESIVDKPTAGMANPEADPSLDARPPRLTIFDWKMQLGTWKHRSHWFLREVGVPAAFADKHEIPSDTLLSARLYAGLIPIEVSMVVNSITSVETVQQRFTADVTWELTLPGITTVREDSVLRELLDLLEFKEDDLEFSNLTEMHSDKPIVTVLSQEGERMHYVDPFVPKETITTKLHHLKYSRRLVAEFNEEMSLYSFPFDQQKLTFAFNMSKSIASFIPIAPRTGDPGRFVLENFKLGNVYGVVFGDKLFVGDVVDSGPTKTIRFEMMLERKSAYYLMNVGIPAAIITYLCFISYAPLKEHIVDGKEVYDMMDTGARLQIVLTLLLTAVTFKYNVASLIPQVSYFTTLDKYVFVCFIITCLVAVENAMYPLVVGLFTNHADNWKEYSLLWFSFWSFTLMNLVWGLYLGHWIRVRNRRTKMLLIVSEYIHVIAHAIPHRHKEQVLLGFIKGLEFFDEKLMPELFTTKRGDLFVRLPSDSPNEEKRKSPHEPTSGIYHKQALRDLPAIQKYFKELEPDCSYLAPSPVNSPAASPVAARGVAAVVAKEYEYGTHSIVVNVNVDDDAAASTSFHGHGGYDARAHTSFRARGLSHQAQ